MTCPAPIFRMLDTPMGDFTIWPGRPFHWPPHEPQFLVEISLGNGDDCMNRITPDALPTLADKMERFAQELRKYHAQLEAADIPITPTPL